MDPKRILHRYLDNQRKALLAKLEGVRERDVRWPMTPTETNLLGLVKHVASVELGYFGEVFDRPSNEPLPWLDQARKMSDSKQPRTHHRGACISRKCGLYMSPRMLPNGSTTDAVTNPASRSVTG